MLYCGFHSHDSFIKKKNHLLPRLSELHFMLSTFPSWLIFICNLTFLCMHVAMETITTSAFYKLWYKLQAIAIVTVPFCSEYCIFTYGKRYDCCLV